MSIFREFRNKGIGCCTSYLRPPSVTQHIAESEIRIENLRKQIAAIVAMNGDTQLQDKMLLIMLKTVTTVLSR